MIAILALIVSTAAAFFAWATASEQRKTRMDDKFPYIVVRSRKNPDTHVDEIRLVNAGRGPAFITKFMTKNLHQLAVAYGHPDWEDGDRTDRIDRVIGPEIGNPDLQCWFAWGTPSDLRVDSKHELVSIGIAYKDIAGREFRSGIIDGKPVWDPPLEFSHTKLCLWLQAFCGKEEPDDSVKRLRAFLGMAIG